MNPSFEEENPRVDLGTDEEGCEPIARNQKLGTDDRQEIGLEEEAWKGQDPIWAVAPY